MLKKFLDENDAKSYALRLLIHYIGDIHQPLHCSTRVNKDYPKGDKGGNMFLLPYHYGSSDLHGVWDSIIYQYHSSVKLVNLIDYLIRMCSHLMMKAGRELGT